ncbi:MAG TPA: lasso peptide biosynthesis B2 protein [Thermoleophilaceae bacterium]|nr:lasso peptide biosynthesis B2 protein [Thermoleophilaceae bacterium]
MARLARSPGEALLAVRVLLVAVSVPLIARLPLARQEALLEPRNPAPPDPEREAWLVANVDRLLSAARPVVRAGCLTRGLTYYFFLRRAGVDVQLRYGLATPIGDSDGHCWLVRDGEPFLERADPRDRYVETYSIPRAHARA